MNRNYGPIRMKDCLLLLAGLVTLAPPVFMIGATFAITYTLLFGGGRWLWALGWGVFVWLAMMVAMPVMMPVIEFPW